MTASKNLQYQLFGHTIQAAAALAAAMPEPKASELSATGKDDYKSQLVEIYAERFSMMHAKIIEAIKGLYLPEVEQ